MVSRPMLLILSGHSPNAIKTTAGHDPPGLDFVALVNGNEETSPTDGDTFYVTSSQIPVCTYKDLATPDKPSDQAFINPSMKRMTKLP
jgi:hypothetical protein